MGTGDLLNLCLKNVPSIWGLQKSTFSEIYSSIFNVFVFFVSKPNHNETCNQPTFFSSTHLANLPAPLLTFLWLNELSLLHLPHSDYFAKKRYRKYLAKWWFSGTWWSPRITDSQTLAVLVGLVWQPVWPYSQIILVVRRGMGYTWCAV